MSDLFADSVWGKVAVNETDMSQITAVGCAALNEDQMHMEYLLTAQIKSVFFSHIY